MRMAPRLGPNHNILSHTIKGKDLKGGRLLEQPSVSRYATWRCAAPDNARGKQEEILIHSLLFDQAGRQHPAPFAKDMQNTPTAKFAQ